MCEIHLCYLSDSVNWWACLCLFFSSGSSTGFLPAAEKTSCPTWTRGDASATDCTHTCPPSPDAASHHLPPDAHTPVPGQPRLLPGLPGDTHHGAGLSRCSGPDTHRTHALLRRTHLALHRAAAAAVPHHQAPQDPPPTEPEHHHFGTVYAVLLLRHAHLLAPHSFLQGFAPSSSSALSAFPGPASYLRSPISSELSRCLYPITAIVTKENQSAVRSWLKVINTQWNHRNTQFVTFCIFINAVNKLSFLNFFYTCITFYIGMKGRITGQYLTATSSNVIFTNCHVF